MLAQAHAADVILSLRMLDTGVAKDVSGVVRVTERDRAEAGAEYLYHVGADGNVKVFERGLRLTLTMSEFSFIFGYCYV